ncbi:MAG TPA: type IX secretion system outer membrane channel protein PorV [Lutibacter sp.]|nr:type IX secretion system outer membrane channel protein PorV [Lutibacter sp.]
MRNKIIALLVIAIFAIPKAIAQEINVDEINAITTAAPFLLISPDARSGAMGDVGVATSPDKNSQHHNPAKAAFNNDEISIGINFTPWMAQLVSGVYLSNLSFTNKLNERSAWATSFKYFTYGEIQLTNDNGDDTTKEKPYELAIDGTYALKLNESFSLGVTGRFIRSDFSIKAQDSDLRAINTISFDVSGYYESAETNYGDFNGIIRGGFNIANIGPKVSFVEDGDKSFLPTNLKLGGGFDFILDDYNKVAVTLETTKLLVPTPPQRDTNGVITHGKDNNVGFFTGMMQSFGDAPEGFKEEMREFTWAVGSEYSYNNAFAFRAGYFHENAKKGARNYFSVGAGFKFRASTIDFSYLFNATQINNPLENTLRFSLGINLGESFDYFQ